MESDSSLNKSAIVATITLETIIPCNEFAIHLNKCKILWSKSDTSKWNNYIDRLICVDGSDCSLLEPNDQATVSRLSKVVFRQQYFPMLAGICNIISILTLYIVCIIDISNDGNGNNNRRTLMTQNDFFYVLFAQSLIKLIDIVCLMALFVFYAPFIVRWFSPCINRFLRKEVFFPFKVKCVKKFCTGH